MDEEQRETKSIRGMKDSVWKKAKEYCIRHEYNNLADFLEDAVDRQCAYLDGKYDK